MPACLFAIINPNQKGLKLFLIALFAPLCFFGQTSLTGLWTGAFSNDSNTIRKDQSFEIALTEYKGKVYGYSRSEFIVDDVLYYIVKRVKGTINGDVCEVKDDEIISFNFPTKLDKGVKVTSTFYRNKVDSTWHLAGTWKTNQTKTFYSITGKVDLAEEQDLSASKLFPHLDELNLSKDIAFYKDRKKQDVVMKTVESEAKMFSSIRNEQQSAINEAISSSGLSNTIDVNTVQVSNTKTIRTNAEPTKTAAIDIPVKTETTQIVAQVNNEPVREKTKIQTEEQKIDQGDAVIKPASETVKVTPVNVSNVNAIRTNPALIKTAALDVPVKTESQQITAQVRSEPLREKTKIKTEEQPINQSLAQATNKNPATDIVKTNTVNTSNTKIIRTNPETKKSETSTIPVKTNVVVSKPITIPETKKPEAEPVIANVVIPQKSLEEIIAPVKTVGGRNSEFAQTVNFKSDSLELSLYDNGEIDGDTVSLFMNGVPLLSKQGLKASAIKKTIYLKPGVDEEFTLVLFAENLGKYPPNTGLLVVHDGEDVYNVRFSADYQKNAGVVFRKKR